MKNLKKIIFLIVLSVLHVNENSFCENGDTTTLSEVWKGVREKVLIPFGESVREAARKASTEESKTIKRSFDDYSDPEKLSEFPDVAKTVGKEGVAPVGPVLASTVLPKVSVPTSTSPVRPAQTPVVPSPRTAAVSKSIPAPLPARTQIAVSQAARFVGDFYNEIMLTIDPMLAPEFKKHLPSSFAMAMNVITHFYVIKQFADFADFVLKKNYPKKYKTVGSRVYYTSLFIGAVLVHYLGSKIVNKLYRMESLSAPELRVYRPLVMNLILPTAFKMAMLFHDFVKTRDFRNKKVLAYSIAMTFIALLPKLTEAGLLALQD